MLKSPLAIKREITCLPSGRKNLLRVPPLAEWKKLDTKHLFCCGLRPPNRRLLDRKLIFDFQKPFDFLPKYTEKCEPRSRTSSLRGKLRPADLPAEALAKAGGEASEQPLSPENLKCLDWSGCRELNSGYRLPKPA